MKILNLKNMPFHLNVTEILTVFCGSPLTTLSKPRTFFILATIAATVLEGNISKNWFGCVFDNIFSRVQRSPSKKMENEKVLSCHEVKFWYSITKCLCFAWFYAKVIIVLRNFKISALTLQDLPFQLQCLGEKNEAHLAHKTITISSFQILKFLSIVIRMEGPYA
jgi:hypothetical protein